MPLCLLILNRLKEAFAVLLKLVLITGDTGSPFILMQGLAPAGWAHCVWKIGLLGGTCV